MAISWPGYEGISALQMWCTWYLTGSCVVRPYNYSQDLFIEHQDFVVCCPIFIFWSTYVFLWKNRLWHSSLYREPQIRCLFTTSCRIFLAAKALTLWNAWPRDGFQVLYSIMWFQILKNVWWNLKASLIISSGETVGAE